MNYYVINAFYFLGDGVNRGHKTQRECQVSTSVSWHLSPSRFNFIVDPFKTCFKTSSFMLFIRTIFFYVISLLLSLDVYYDKLNVF